MKKLKILLLALAATISVGAFADANDVTASYIGDLSRVVNGNGHNCNNNHKMSQGIGFYNTQNLQTNGWHAFVGPGDSGVGESWTSGNGSKGIMMGRMMVLPAGNYTLKFSAFGCTATNATNQIPSSPGDVVAFCTGQTDIDITNTTLGGNIFHDVEFTFDVTTPNTSIEFGIKKVADESYPDWCQIKSIKLYLNSTDISPIANDKVELWNQTFDGSDQNGKLQCNTWSTEGQSDGTNFMVPFIEDWVASGNTLSDQTISGSYTPTQKGVYKVTAWVRAINEAGGAISGAKIYVGDIESDACGGATIKNGVLGTYTAMADGKLGTPIEFGLRLKDAAINWLSFKNFTITYLGASLPQADVDAILETVPTGNMSSEVKEALDNCVNALKNDASVTNYNALAVAIANANASIALYAKIKVVIDKVEANISAIGKEALLEYISKYDDGSATETTYNEFLAAYIVQLKANPKDGADLTEIIVNPSFEDGLSDWSQGDASLKLAVQTNSSFTMKDGNKYIEYWQPKGTMKAEQKISDLHTGVYEVSVAALARGLEYANLYINDVKVPMEIADKTQRYKASIAVDAEASITIGVEAEGTGAGNSWFAFDDFRLTLVSASLPDVTKAEGKMNKDVSAAQDVAVETYNNNKTIANYNAALVAIEAAKASIAIYAQIAAINTKAAALDAAGQAAYAETLQAYDDGTLETVKEAQDAFIAATKAQSTVGSDWSILGSNKKDDWVGASGTYQAGVELYTGDVPAEAKVLMSQTIEGLMPGAKYEVKFYAAANVARNLTEEYYGDGIAYVFANATQQDITVGQLSGGSFETEEFLRTIVATVGEDGKLEFGLGNKKVGGQWYVAQFVSLKLVELVWDFNAITASETDGSGNLQGNIVDDDGTTWSYLQNNKAITDEELTVSEGVPYAVTKGLKFTTGGSDRIRIRNYPEANGGKHLFSNNNDVMVRVPATAGQYIVFEAYGTKDTKIVYNEQNLNVVKSGNCIKYVIKADEANPSINIQRNVRIKKIYVSGSKPYGTIPELASNAYYSWQSPEGTVEEVGGSAIASEGDPNRVNYSQAPANVQYYTISLNGKKDLSDAKYTTVTLERALAEGDTIIVYAFKNKGEEKKSGVKFFWGAEGTESVMACGDDFPDLWFGGEPKLVKYVVPAAAAGQKVFRMTRSETGTNLFIAQLQIVPAARIVPVTSIGWASLYYDKALSIPEGAEAYYASAIHGSWVTLTKIDGKIPANTGVLVKAAEGNVEFTEINESVDAIEGNLFEGVLEETPCESMSVYVLDGRTTVTTPEQPVFNLYSGTTLGAYKAYIPKDKISNGAKELFFEFDGGTTGIKGISSNGYSPESKALYNLNGVRVNENYKGIIISNGRKVLRR